MGTSSSGSPQPVEGTIARILDTEEVPPPPKQAASQTADQRRMIALSMEQFSGPMPHPGQLAKYEEICPGAADRMLRMAEAEAEHRRSCEARVVEAQIADNDRWHDESKRGQICALAIVIVAIVAGSAVAYSGHPVAGSVISGSSVTAIVGIFIAGRRRSEEKKPETPPQPKPRGKRNRNK